MCCTARTSALVRPRLTPDGLPIGKPPLIVRLLMDFAPVAELRERLIAFGGWQPERVRTPQSSAVRTRLRLVA